MQVNQVERIPDAYGAAVRERTSTDVVHKASRGAAAVVVGQQPIMIDARRRESVDSFSSVPRLRMGLNLNGLGGGGAAAAMDNWPPSNNDPLAHLQTTTDAPPGAAPASAAVAPPPVGKARRNTGPGGDLWNSAVYTYRPASGALRQSNPHPPPPAEGGDFNDTLRSATGPLGAGAPQSSMSALISGVMQHPVDISLPPPPPHALQQQQSDGAGVPILLDSTHGSMGGADGVRMDLSTSAGGGGGVGGSGGHFAPQCDDGDEEGDYEQNEEGEEEEGGEEPVPTTAVADLVVTQHTSHDGAVQPAAAPPSVRASMGSTSKNITVLGITASGLASETGPISSRHSSPRIPAGAPVAAPVTAAPRSGVRSSLTSGMASGVVVPPPPPVPVQEVSPKQGVRGGNSRRRPAPRRVTREKMSAIPTESMDTSGKLPWALRASAEGQPSNGAPAAAGGPDGSRGGSRRGSASGGSPRSIRTNSASGSRSGTGGAVPSPLSSVKGPQALRSGTATPKDKDPPPPPSSHDRPRVPSRDGATQTVTQYSSAAPVRTAPASSFPPAPPEIASASGDAAPEAYPSPARRQSHRGLPTPPPPPPSQQQAVQSPLTTEAAVPAPPPVMSSPPVGAPNATVAAAVSNAAEQYHHHPTTPPPPVPTQGTLIRRSTQPAQVIRRPADRNSGGGGAAPVPGTMRISTTTLTKTENKVRFLELHEPFDPDAPDPTDGGGLTAEEEAALLDPSRYANQVEEVVSQHPLLLLDRDQKLAPPLSGIPAYLLNDGRRWVRRSNRPAVASTKDPAGAETHLPAPPANPHAARSSSERQDTRDYDRFPAYQVVPDSAGQPAVSRKEFLLQRHVQQMATGKLARRTPYAVPRKVIAEHTVPALTKAEQAYQLAVRTAQQQRLAEEEALQYQQQQQQYGQSPPPGGRSTPTPAATRIPNVPMLPPQVLMAALQNSSARRRASPPSSTPPVTDPASQNAYSMSGSASRYPAGSQLPPPPVAPSPNARPPAHRQVPAVPLNPPTAASRQQQQQHPASYQPQPPSLDQPRPAHRVYPSSADPTPLQDKNKTRNRSDDSPAQPPVRSSSQPYIPTAAASISADSTPHHPQPVGGGGAGATAAAVAPPPPAVPPQPPRSHHSHHPEDSPEDEKDEQVPAHQQYPQQQAPPASVAKAPVVSHPRQRTNSSSMSSANAAAQPPRPRPSPAAALPSAAQPQQQAPSRLPLYQPRSREGTVTSVANTSMTVPSQNAVDHHSHLQQRESASPPPVSMDSAGLGPAHAFSSVATTTAAPMKSSPDVGTTAVPPSATNRFAQYNNYSFKPAVAPAGQTSQPAAAQHRAPPPPPPPAAAAGVVEAEAASTRSTSTSSTATSDSRGSRRRHQLPATAAASAVGSAAPAPNVVQRNLFHEGGGGGGGSRRPSGSSRLLGDDRVVVPAQREVPVAHVRDEAATPTFPTAPAPVPVTKPSSVSSVSSTLPSSTRGGQTLTNTAERISPDAMGSRSTAAAAASAPFAANANVPHPSSSAAAAAVASAPASKPPAVTSPHRSIASGSTVSTPSVAPAMRQPTHHGINGKAHSINSNNDDADSCDTNTQPVPVSERGVDDTPLDGDLKKERPPVRRLIIAGEEVDLDPEADLEEFEEDEEYLEEGDEELPDEEGEEDELLEGEEEQGWGDSDPAAAIPQLTVDQHMPQEVPIGLIGATHSSRYDNIDDDDE